MSNKREPYQHELYLAVEFMMLYKLEEKGYHPEVDYSDDGTYFIKANSELMELVKEIEREEVDYIV